MENIMAVYNNVADSQLCKDEGYLIRRKKKSQISGRKLRNIQEKQELVSLY
jgi:hypothetical protein